MANPYTKIYVQAVFAVKHQKALLKKEHRPEIFKYMSGVLDNRGHKSLAVNGYHDHVHLLFDFIWNMGGLATAIFSARDHFRARGFRLRNFLFCALPFFHLDQGKRGC